MKPYYDHAGITIYHGDCREILPQVGWVHLVLTDPPYGFRKAEWDSRFDVPWDLFGAAAPVLAVMPGIWNLPECPRRVGDLEYRWCLAAHLTNGMTRGCIGFGNWIPCLVWTTPNVSAYKVDGDCRDFAVGREVKPDHPSPKPYNVIRWFLDRLPGESVCDPFMGSGTTLVAAKNLGRKAIGIEIEERYCEIAAERLAQEVLPFGTDESAPLAGGAGGES